MEIIAGTSVFNRANPGRLGVLTGRAMQAMFLMAEVNWGNQFEYVDASQLVVCDPNARPNTDTDVRTGRYGTLDDLRRRITFEKLQGVLTDVFYSMKTSEIDFYPHQFKPALRFIESPTNRLLIADEVGLGKTIEAGLIWTEWQARQKARRLLVVCPPTLCPKWLRELQDRFQLPAEATDARHLLELTDRFDRKGPGLTFVLVGSYHSLRPSRKERDQLSDLTEDQQAEQTVPESKLSPRVKLLKRLKEWDAAEPFLDMVVFDEMHIMKETRTGSHYLGETLTAAAGAMVGLSATPIHNKSRDLYALLHLVDPDVFRDERGFDDLRRHNLPVVQLQNAIATSTWQPPDVLPLVDKLYSSEAQAKLRDVLRDFDGSPRRRVEIRHAVERMNLLSNFISRTRKRDVIENRVIRQPVTFPVVLSPQESAFYNFVLALVRNEVQRRGEPVTSFHLIHPALRMASSLPVVAGEVLSGKWGGFEEIESLADEYDLEVNSRELEGPPITEQLRHLANFDFEKNDSKYAELRTALQMISANALFRSDTGHTVFVSSSDKVIVFAFFKATIAYLERRLKDDGFKTIAITGDIKDRYERDRMLQRFEADENRILLCSEIGAEGIDLQFARVVVNYDLPWNPMRVEQRIGRIDRIGQESPTIVIINFHVRDTIDGSIFKHLYAKIGVFERTIGALEGILGEEIAKLTNQIFSQDLTREQIAERTQQTAAAVSQRAAIEEQLENSTGALVAFDDLLSEKIGDSQRLGRFIKPSELRLHTDDFFTTKFQGPDACLLHWDNPAQACLYLKLSFAALSQFETFCQVQEYPWPSGFSRNTRSASLTFDPAVHQGLKRKLPQLTLVTHLHPFFRWITKSNHESNNEWHKVSAVRLETTEFPQGKYFYLVYRLTLEGITRRDAFHYAIKNLSTSEVETGNRAESLLSLALDVGKSAFPLEAADHCCDLIQLRNALASELQSAQQNFREDQARKSQIRQEQVISHFNRRIESQRRRIATAEDGSQLARRGLAGFRRQLANLEAERDHQLTKLRHKFEGLNDSFREVACGLIEVALAKDKYPARNEGSINA